MKKELAPKPQNQISTYVVDQSLLDDLDTAEASDFVFNRLTLIQPTSKIPGNAGDVIDSSTGEVIIKLGEKLSFVPVMFFKSFTVSDKNTKKFLRNETKEPRNAHRSVFDNRLEQTPDGQTHEWVERLNMFVILQRDLCQEMPNVYQMIVKRSSFPEAKKFLTDWTMQINCRQAPFSFVWSVRPKLITDEKGKYVTLEFLKEMDDGHRVRVASEQMPAVEYWVRTMKNNKNAITRVVATKDDDVQEAEVVPF